MFKKKIISLLFLVILLSGTLYVLQQPGNIITKYDEHIFYPFQSFRISVLGLFPFSVGDVLYVLGGIWALVTIVRWVYFGVHFRRYKESFGISVLSAVNTILFVYLFFIAGWGANYNKPSLAESWGLSSSAENEFRGPLSPQYLSELRHVKRSKDSTALVAFNRFLVDRLNSLAPHYQNLSFDAVNDRAKKYYMLYTSSKVKENGLSVKPSFFSYFMERTGIDGYYNPFTGEGQANTNLPGFVMPFIICHEMAHQAGIAAEGDANLMSYTLGTMADDVSFNYSSYLNIWLYANNRLYRWDSVQARGFELQLNKLTAAHLDTLEQISRKYHNEVAHYSSELYDSYLKMQDQKEGIRSYSDVAISAWQLELKRRREKKGAISIP